MFPINKADLPVLVKIYLGRAGDFSHLAPASHGDPPKSGKIGFISRGHQKHVRFFTYKKKIFSPLRLQSYLLFISNVINSVKVCGDRHTPVNKCKDNDECWDNFAV